MMTQAIHAQVYWNSVDPVMGVLDDEVNNLQ